MSDAPSSWRLLTAVSRRLRLKHFGVTLFQAFVCLAGLYLLALVASRLSGFGAPFFGWESAAAVPVVALLAALALHRTAPIQEAARAVDQVAGSRDLFLTLSQLQNSAGGYQPLVIQEAEQRATRILPATVVSFGWHRRHGHALSLIGLVVLTMLFLPQYDPFGKVAQASLSTVRKERLDDSRKQTKLRVAEVQKELEETENAAESERAIEQLQLTFNKMQPREKQLNFESLTDEQKRLADLYRRLANDPLQKLLNPSQHSKQQFGAGEDEMMQKWNRELQAGSTAGMQQEMQDLKEQLQKLAKTQDPVEKEAVKKELKERLDQLQKFSEKALENPKLSAALQRAMSQLDLSSLDELSSEALEGAMESLELSELELEQLAQAAQDMKKLEEALKNIQMAKRLNDFEQLDGQKSQQCKSMSDYEKLYKEMLAKCQGGQCQGGQCLGPGKCTGGTGKCAGNGNGAGMGGAGTGQGNIAPEDNSITTEFQNDLAKSAVTAGKVLMSMKSKGLGERGQANIDYRALLQQVQQGASEAILQEQIPPGYHDGIKSYFDTLQPATPASQPAKEATAPAPQE